MRRPFAPLAVLACCAGPAAAQAPCVGPPTELAPASSEGFRFGAQVRFAGDVLAVSDWWEREVTVFRRGESGWSFEQLLVPSTGASNFGSSLAADGTTLAVGAMQVIGGRVFVFEYIAGSWEEVAVLSPSTGGSESFGMAVALDGDRLAVSAPNVGGRVSLRAFPRGMGGGRLRRGPQFFRCRRGRGAGGGPAGRRQ